MVQRRETKPLIFPRTAAGALAVAALTAIPIGAQTTTRVSQTRQPAFTPDISADGSRIAFGMGFSITSGLIHVWVYDTATGLTTDVTPGDQMHAVTPRLSDDGLWVSYTSPSLLVGVPPGNDQGYLYLEELATGNLILISETHTGTATSGAYARMSADGRQVVFESASTDLTADAVLGGIFQIYVRDLDVGTTTLITRALGGGGANAQSRFPDISADGRWVVFESGASDLVAGVLGVQIYVRDRDPDENGVFDEGNGVTRLLSRNAAGVPGDIGSFWPSISDDARFVAYDSSSTNLVPGDTNGDFDVFVLDRDFDENGVYDDTPAHNIRASLDSLGNQVIFISRSDHARISGDGQRVLFRSNAWALVPNTSHWLHVYLHDLTTGQTTCVSVDSSYDFADASSATHAGSFGTGYLAIDGEGERVVFVSEATNLAPGDTNGAVDVFMHDVPDNPGIEMGSSLAGSGGIAPDFTAYGGPPYVLRLRRTLPSAKAFLMFSHLEGSFALFGGTVIPLRPLVWGPHSTDADGSLDLSVNRRVGHTTLFTQWLVRDPGAAQGWALSNALQLFPDGLTGGDSPPGRNAGPP